MDGPQEYEVESITRARVHDKRGKKITWRYYVKWKGYDWDESTWEPTDSFQGGSEHILESFWERIDTRGRDISDATAFKKGEELVISGPPVRKGLKRKANPANTQVSPLQGVSSSNGVTISAPPLATRKRRRVQITADDEGGYSKPKRSVSTTDLKNGGSSAKSLKRRRASSPGLRKSAPKRQPSAGDSQLDADGETDPDVVEVEDELMQVSTEDVEEDNVRMEPPAAEIASANESEKIAFDDLEHFYSGNPIDVDQNMDGQLAAQKLESRSRLQSPPTATVLPPDDAAPESQAPTSPPLSSSDPLFDSPPCPSDEAPQIQSDLPAHRARAANPRVKRIDTTTLETMSKQSRITAKARLMSIHTADVPSASSPGGSVANRGGKPGPDRSSAGLITKNRSSLLTATKGTLKSVKGTFSNTAIERDQPHETEETSGRTEGDNAVVASCSDKDIVVGQDHQAMSNPQLAPPPSGEELLKLAGLQTDMETLPDYEDNSSQDVKVEESNPTSAPAEELPSQSLAEVKEESKTIDPAAGVLSSVSKLEPTALTSDTKGPSTPPVVPPIDEAIKTKYSISQIKADLALTKVRSSIELAKEHLFPPTQTSFNSFSTTHSSFQSTIFGPLYQGSTANHASVAKDDPSTTFKVILGDGNELPLVLEDCGGIKARIGDILIGNSSGSKVALFYSAADALAMTSALKGDGTARVVLDPSATTTQRECFSTFLQRFESSHTLVAPVGREICVLFSSENAGIAEKLGAPAHLRGLSSTILISHASIENQLAYVAAAMQATVL